MKRVKDLKQWDLVELLSRLGYEPSKVIRDDYWYLSPLRVEKTPSFKVNRRLNVWYDHGVGQGGDLIDFGCQYCNCSISDLLRKWDDLPSPTFSFQPRIAGEKKNNTEGVVSILGIRPVTDQHLLAYLDTRSIPHSLVESYCKEIDFSLHNRQYRALGFKNDAGGYELRNADFKGCCAPKDVTLIVGTGERLNIFEGFFSFLSYLACQKVLGDTGDDFLILNSLSLLGKAIDLTEKYTKVALYLDNDIAGKRATSTLKTSDRFSDCSSLYQGFKDINDWWINRNKPIQKVMNSVRRGLRR
ncbi:toprim domain-containing protein [Chitinophaga sp. Hz27]|uniref:toprim domain-containing protein n=1 Tax=Chitinophaga sp. Hz27 TaxID=3347169 RepID=UPI0035D5F8EB